MHKTHNLSRRSLRSQDSTRYLLVLPWIIHIIAFVIFPLVFAIYLVFNDWNVVQGTFSPIGLKNLKRLVGDANLGKAIVNTLLLTIVNVTLVTGLALGMALLLNAKLRGTAFFRTIYFLPIITSTVVVALVWRYLLAADLGFVNYVLSLYGIEGPMWLLDPKFSLSSVIAMLIWLGTPFTILIFLAGLQAIPRELYEAAVIDGAGAWNSFQHITIPLLNPTLVLVVLLATISSLQVFTEALVLTQGGPAGSSTTIAVYMYEQGIVSRRYGYASLIGLSLAIGLFVLVMVQRRVLERRIDY